jgi:hypothetical protein
MKGCQPAIFRSFLRLNRFQGEAATEEDRGMGRFDAKARF